MPADAVASNAVAYRDPGRGRCGVWVLYLKANGYDVVTYEDQSLIVVKSRLSVSYGAASCITCL